MNERPDMHRRQVLDGLARAIERKGYAATTIADIAAAARASRSTVYAEFPDKTSALIALHRSLVDRGLEALDRAQPTAGAWPERVAALTRTYLDQLASASPGERMSLVEVASAGPRAREARRTAQDRLAERVVALTAEIAARHPGARALTPSLALAAISAVNELVLRASERGPDAVSAVAPDATELFVSLMRRP
jgi:AcrR family transcriptional regulator